MIINPIWFYLIGVADSLKTILCAISWISGIVAGIGVFAAAIEENPKWLKLCYVKTMIIITTITIIMGCLTPSEKTCYHMLAASVVTKNNIEYTINTGKDIVDYIIESVEQIMETGTGE